MNNDSNEKQQGTQPASPEGTQKQPQSGAYQPNRNIQPPQYQIVTEGYDPPADIARKNKKG